MQEEHERRLERKIIPGVVKIRCENEQATVFGGRLHKRRLAVVELSDRGGPRIELKLDVIPELRRVQTKARCPLKGLEDAVIPIVTRQVEHRLSPLRGGNI